MPTGVAQQNVHLHNGTAEIGSVVQSPLYGSDSPMRIDDLLRKLEIVVTDAG
jgi:hypothetical protein